MLPLIERSPPVTPTIGRRERSGPRRAHPAPDARRLRDLHRWIRATGVSGGSAESWSAAACTGETVVRGRPSEIFNLCIRTLVRSRIDRMAWRESIRRPLAGLRVFLAGPANEYVQTALDEGTGEDWSRSLEAGWKTTVPVHCHSQIGDLS